MDLDLANKAREAAKAVEAAQAWFRQKQTMANDAKIEEIYAEGALNQARATLRNIQKRASFDGFPRVKVLCNGEDRTWVYHFEVPSEDRVYLFTNFDEVEQPLQHISISLKSGRFSTRERGLTGKILDLTPFRSGEFALQAKKAQGGDE